MSTITRTEACFSGLRPLPSVRHGPATRKPPSGASRPAPGSQARRSRRRSHRLRALDPRVERVRPPSRPGLSRLRSRGCRDAGDSARQGRSPRVARRTACEPRGADRPRRANARRPGGRKPASLRSRSTPTRRAESGPRSESFSGPGRSAASSTPSPRSAAAGSAASAASTGKRSSASPGVAGRRAAAASGSASSPSPAPDAAARAVTSPQRRGRVSATYGSRREATAVAEGAAAATRGLYERHGQRVFTFCVNRLRDAEEAQDATQTTFLYAMRSDDNGVKPRFELAWLLAIAQNVCRSTRRSLDRREARASFADATELEAAAESLGEESGEELAWIREALERLPETPRRAVLLREWQGLSYADIAAELHLSLAAVETLLFRARRSLAAQLDRAKRGLKAFDLSSLGFLLRTPSKAAR